VEHDPGDGIDRAGLFAAEDDELRRALSLTTTGDSAWELGTGGGITVRSTAAEECAETGWKAERLIQVFDPP
jgi:hypothetical protein